MKARFAARHRSRDHDSSWFATIIAKEGPLWADVIRVTGIAGIKR
jgi:hypothetical protein